MLPTAAPARRIVLSGPESSGKSTLARALADTFGLPVAMEFARHHLEAGGDYPRSVGALADLARSHLAWQARQVPVDSAWGIFDTDLLNYHIWAEVAFGCVPEVITRGMLAERGHVHLLCAPDLAWEPDPLREYPDLENRRALFERHRDELEARGIRYFTIQGEGKSRVDAAIEAVAAVIRA